VGSNDWFIKAKKIVLNLDEGQAKADKVSLSFKDIPILYIPKISFPLGDARKSGFLAPEIGGGGRSGNEIRLPWYWNIAKNYDATITPRILTGRGFQLGNEFRYLSSANKGQLKLDYLNNDNIFGKSRHYIQFNNETNFANGIRATIDYGNTSDGNYFEDLGGNLSMTSITHLNQNIMVDAFGENWSVLARFQNFQTIDKSIQLTDRPYARLPQIKFNASLPYKPLGISASLDSEIVFFNREVGTTGWRIDTQPQLDWSIKNDGWYVNPSIALKHTQYELKNLEKGQISDPSRTLPIASLDAGLFFERPLKNYNNHTQTFEPRLLYLSTPYRDQNNLPIFDTIEPDLNLVQLFQKNRFIGIDRIADMEQISLGFGSKIIDNKDGKEVISMTLGKAFYLKNQKVTLPGENLLPSSNSDFIAELRFLIFDDLNFDISHQWNNENTGVARSQARLQYRSKNNKILNFGYRFRQNLLEQGNISWSWPISERWNVLGHYNYSIRDKKTLEQFYGLEYESCCWAVRMVYRQYVSTRDGQEDTSLGIQLVLKGMTSIGTKADKLLERGILGYSNYIQ
jgi:LPS-assembly protein